MNSPTAPADVLRIDLYADWIELLRQDLAQRGYTVPASDEPQQIAFKHRNVARRDIEATPRDVLRAKSFSVPPEYASSVQEIDRKAASGQPLTPHLSRKLLDLNYHDALLNDWGIHHLHLGTTLESDGFTKRSGPLLFVRVTRSRFLMIGVLPHRSSWTDESLMETLLTDWPEELAPLEAKGVLGLAQPISGLDRSKLRAANICIPLQLSNGKVYFPLGGGPTTAGISANVVRQELMWRHTLCNVEKFIRDNLARFAAALPAGIRFAERQHFRLVGCEGDVLFLKEQESGQIFRFPLS